MPDRLQRSAVLAQNGFQVALKFRIEFDVLGPQFEPGGVLQQLAHLAVFLQFAVVKNGDAVAHVGRYLSGTSIAAPFVTALIAADPAGPGTVADARARLARASRDIGEAGPDETFGAGLPTVGGACPG
jgi:hypothetical protein